MAGKKGRSGKRPRHEEVRIAQLATMSIDWGIKHWSKMKDSEKMKVLMVLAPKYVPTKVEHSGDLTLTLADRMQEARKRAFINN